MPKTTRDDGRDRLLTIAPGWPARTVASILAAAADITEEAAVRAEPESTSGWAREQRDVMATPVVEPRSDGIAVYASTVTKGRNP